MSKSQQIPVSVPAGRTRLVLTDGEVLEIKFKNCLPARFTAGRRPRRINAAGTTQRCDTCRCLRKDPQQPVVLTPFGAMCWEVAEGATCATSEILPHRRVVLIRPEGQVVISTDGHLTIRGSDGTLHQRLPSGRAVSYRNDPPASAGWDCGSSSKSRRE